MITDFPIPEQARIALREPMGRIVTEVELKKLDESKLITVGDATTLTAFKHSITPRLCIFDHFVERKPFEDKNLLGKPDFKTNNEAGIISLDAWNLLAKALEQEHTKILVDGEEDLLTLAALFLAPLGYMVAYGQPGKGIVLVEVTEQNKQKYAELLIRETAREFLKNCEGLTAILHDDDADGGCSAVQFLKYFEREGKEAIPLITNDATIHANVEQEVRKHKPQNVLMLDFGMEARKKINTMSMDMRILVLDHHRIWEEADFGKGIYLNPHMFNVPEAYVAPTSALSDIICETAPWIAAIGTIADKGFTSGAALLARVKEENPGLDFNRLKDLMNAADSMGDPHLIVDALHAAKTPEDILQHEKLNAYYTEIHTELDSLMRASETDAKWLSPNVLFYEINPQHEMRGAIANALQKKYPDKIVIIGQQEQNHFYMSFRTIESTVNLVPVIKNAIRDLKDSNGGGHAKACGSKVLAKDKETFLARVVKAIG